MATNEILRFAEIDTGTNLLTQTEYSADSQRPIGNQSGVARSKLVNKALRQSSLIAAAVAQFIADNQANNVVDTATPADIADWIEAAVCSITNDQYVQYAPLASPALTGTPTAPTAATGTNTTQVATTAFVNAEIAADRPLESTLAEMEAGTEANVRSMSPLRVAQAIAALGESGLGDGQVWTDVKASRAYGVTYTNSTGRPIEVFVTNSGGSHLLKATVGSVVLGQQMSTYNTSTPRQCFSFVVPNGSTYKVDCTGTLEYWTELR